MAEMDKANVQKAENQTKSSDVGASSEDLTGKVAQHYNQLQEAGLEQRTQSRIFYLRNFNNWIKSMLINEHLTLLKSQRDGPITVLDLCSGKGGDLLKWRKGGISKLVCADIAATSVEQGEERYKDMVQRAAQERYQQRLFSAEFISADCTKERLADVYKDASIIFDLVSCQFSFHYCFESLAQAEMMVRNACEKIKPGGYFIGTTPNSNEIMKRLRASDDMSFGGEVYRITFPGTDKEHMPIFGAKYDFHLEGVVDCPEFLVYFPAFEKLAEKYGMKLCYKKPFARYFKEKVAEGEGRTLLGKMQALEPYPAESDIELLSKLPDAYSEAERHTEKLKHDNGGERRGPQKVGTLSQSEWDATTIYLVFVFQKVSDGAPSSEVNEGIPETLKRKRSHSPSGADETKVQKVETVSESQNIKSNSPPPTEGVDTKILKVDEEDT